MIHSSSTRQNTLDAFLSRGTATKPVGAPSRTGVENIPPAVIAGENAPECIEDDIEDDDEAIILARWRRVYDGVTASSSTAVNDDTASRRSRAVARAAYAYAVARANARRRARNSRNASHDSSFMGDLRRSQCVVGRGDAAKRLKLAASGVASRSLGEYGECALPHASLARLSARNNAVNAIEFDSCGAYVTSGTNGGAIDVLEVGSLRETRGELYCPKVKLSTERYIEALKWNPARNAIMTVSDSSNVVIAYRATPRALGPRRASTASAAAQSDILQNYIANAHGQASSGFGLHDLICDPNDPHAIVACSSHGQAFVWDTRVPGGKHRGELSSHLKSPLQSLVMSDDGHTVIAGVGDRSDLLIWDMRKQSAKSGTSFGMLGVKTERYDLIAHLSIAKLLQKSALGVEMMIPKTGVHWIGNDPADSRRLGFHLANGWSGVVDLLKPCVTHAHCPPAPWLEVNRQHNAAVNDVQPDALSVPIRDLRRRRACWVPGVGTFAVGMGVKPGVRVLDFTPTTKSRHWVHGLTMADLDKEPEMRYATGNEPVLIETSTKIFTVAAHPLHHGELIAGGESALSLIGYIAERPAEENPDDERQSLDATHNENIVAL